MALAEAGNKEWTKQKKNTNENHKDEWWKVTCAQKINI